MSDDQKTIDLPTPTVASHECLPHAAMAIGMPAGTERMVSRLVLERHADLWTLYRIDEGGGFIGDTTHGSSEDALHQIRREFGDDAEALMRAE